MLPSILCLTARAIFPNIYSGHSTNLLNLPTPRLLAALQSPAVTSRRNVIWPAYLPASSRWPFFFLCHLRALPYMVSPFVWSISFLPCRPQLFYHLCSEGFPDSTIHVFPSPSHSLFIFSQHSSLTEIFLFIHWQTCFVFSS